MNITINKLLDICSVSTGKKDANHNTDDGQYPFYTCAYKPIKSPTYSFEGESIILPGNGANVGLVLAYNGKFEAYQRTYVLNNFKADFRYVFHHLNKYWKAKNSNTQYGSATNYIRMQNFVDYEIPLPPLHEQKRIADILDKGDSLRKKRKQAIDQCDDFLKSTFLHMFGDPVTNPRKWVFKEIEKILDIPLKAGAYYPKNKYTNDFNGIEMVHMSDAFYNKVKRGSLKRVDASRDEIEKYSINFNDILIARRSLTYEGAAKPCRIPISKETLIFESSLIRVRTNKKEILPIFFFYYINNDIARTAFLLKNVTKSTISGISQAGLNRTEIYVPPLPLQQKFASIVEKTEAVKQKMQKQLKELDDNFNSLMQRAFKGEL